MAKLDVCVVGELNLDLILYGLPKELVLERELLASGLAMTLGSSSANFCPQSGEAWEQGWFSSPRLGMTSLGNWPWNVWQLAESTWPE